MRFFKKSVFVKVIVSVITGQFLFTGIPLDVHADFSGQSNLRMRSAIKKGEIVDALDGGVLETIGSFYKNDPLKRREQLLALLTEINKELAQPGRGSLPRCGVISDFHGDIQRFAQLLSIMLNKLCGFQGQLNPGLSIEQQLKEQNISLKDMNGSIILNGDLADRGPYGIKCFLLARELVKLAPEKVIFNPGNHGFYVGNSLSARHLPVTEDFDYLNYTSKFLVMKHRDPADFQGEKEKLENILWWASHLADYNEDMEAFQKEVEQEVFDGKIKEIREGFIRVYEQHQDKWTDEQISVWEDFVGSFIRIKVPKPYVGLNGIGKTSSEWWIRVHNELMRGYEARSNLEADADELNAWKRAVDFAGIIDGKVAENLDRAVLDEKWWYPFFQSINTQAYTHWLWWAKDWSSHPGWGENVLKELNELINDPSIVNEFIRRDRKEFAGEEVTQKNYHRSHTLRAWADFSTQNYNLYARTPYGTLITHGWLPVETEGENRGRVILNFRGKKYADKDVLKGLDAISSVMKNPDKDITALYEALGLVNAWFSDKTLNAPYTSPLKPNFVKKYLEIGIAEIQSRLDVNIWVNGHNPVNKLGIGFMTQDGEYAHIEIDNSMAPKFGRKGAIMIEGPEGIKFYGFETGEDDAEIMEAPNVIIPAKKEGAEPTVIANPGMPARKYLELIQRTEPAVLLQALDARVFDEFSQEYDSFMASLEGAKGALVIGSHTVFGNPGIISALKKIKQSKADFKIAVWAKNNDSVRKLKAMGLEDTADIMSSQGLEDVLYELEQDDIAKEQITLINSDLDLENIKSEYAEYIKTDVLAFIKEDLKCNALNIGTAKIDEEKVFINSMPLVLARAIAIIRQNDTSVIEAYKKLTRSYRDNNQITNEDLETLNDFTSQVAGIPLVIVSEGKGKEIAQAQITYQQTAGSI